MSVTVGIVTWNSASVIEACLASVRAQTCQPLTLLVLDNASDDDTRARLARSTDPAERLDSDRNLGFSAAHNRLIAETTTEFYLCLNPDVVLAPDFLERIIAALRRDPEAGSATGKLLRAHPRPERQPDRHFDPHAEPRRESRGNSHLGPRRDLGQERLAARPDESLTQPGQARDPGADIIDSTGIVMLRSQRHLDRGADCLDTGQYAREEYVFGASGAAACYRRAMLEDVKVPRAAVRGSGGGRSGGSGSERGGRRGDAMETPDILRPNDSRPAASSGGNSGPMEAPRDDEYFDEDFFAYREDADLAWRAQLLGWRCLYVPDAVARHGRRVTPERRGALPAAINAWSVRNRFLLRLKNQTVGHALRFLLPTLARDLQVVGYVLLKERTSLRALGDVIRLLPRTWAKRRAIMARRRRPTREMIAWFTRDAAPLRR